MLRPLLLLALCASTLADPVSAIRPDPITYGTECGALGTGRRIGPEHDGKLYTEQTPGLRVAEDGYWTNCTPPKKRCQAQRLMVWGHHSKLCIPDPPNLPEAEEGAKQFVFGRPSATERIRQRGTQHWACTPDGWVMESSTCQRVRTRE